MNRLFKRLKEYRLSYDIIISFLGLLLIIFLILVFLNPKNRLLFMAAFLSGGLINIFNGLKVLRDPKKKSMALSYLFFGIIIIVIGVFMKV